VPELLIDSRFANAVILINMVWLAFPGDLVIWGGTFARIPNELMDAAKIDGTTWWLEFTKVVVPMVWPTGGLKMVLMTCGVFGASGAVFLLTKGNYGTMTLSCWMYLQLLNSSGNQYTSNVYNYMSAVGLILTVASVVIAVIVRKNANKIFEEVEY
jgi:multiple sugar transport system permease protein/N-acetylglucosamine transport system permease protein